MKEEIQYLKTGTTTLAFMCKDGIVMAADKRATAGYSISSKKFQKIYEITNFMAITTAGVVSDIQLLVKLLKAQLKLKDIRADRASTTKEAANLLAGMVYSNIRKFSAIPGVAQFLMGGKDSEGFHVYEIYADGSVSEIEDFVSSGSGSDMAYGVLETMYKKDMTVDEGIKIAAKALNASIQRDVASGSGFDIVTITKDGIKKVVSKQLEVKVEL